MDNRMSNYSCFSKLNKGSRRVYTQGRCPFICPQCGNQCTLAAGHWGKHKCTQGHEWL